MSTRKVGYRGAKGTTRTLTSSAGALTFSTSNAGVAALSTAGPATSCVVTLGAPGYAVVDATDGSDVYRVEFTVDTPASAEKGESDAVGFDLTVGP